MEMERQAAASHKNTEIPGVIKRAGHSKKLGYLFAIIYFMLKSISSLVILVGMLTFPRVAGAIDTHDTRMLSQPAVSADHIAFIYAEDLWVAGPDGSNPRRLTVSEGIESNPVFSPDGKTIAFSAQY